MYDDKLQTLYRDLDSLYDHEKVYAVVNTARRYQQGLEIYTDTTGYGRGRNRGTSTWIVWEVFTINSVPHYWLVSKEGNIISSYCINVTTSRWPKYFKCRSVSLDDYWIDDVARPHLITPSIRSDSTLHYTNSRRHRGWERTNPKWTSVSERDLGIPVSEIELGKLYRVIGVGAMIPIFRLPGVLLGLRNKSR